MSTLGFFFSAFLAIIGLGTAALGIAWHEPIFVAVGLVLAAISGFALWGARMKRPT